MNKLKRLKNDTKGFTLMEMIIVVVIIGILVAILVPNMASWIGKSKKTAFETEANSIKQTISAELVDRYAAGEVISDEKDGQWKWSYVEDKIEKKDGQSLEKSITFKTDDANNIKEFTYKDNDFSIKYTDGKWEDPTPTPKSNK